ncbi:unnamed protein product, partial [Polarella glacialis]
WCGGCTWCPPTATQEADILIPPTEESVNVLGITGIGRGATGAKRKPGVNFGGEEVQLYEETPLSPMPARTSVLERKATGFLKKEDIPDSEDEEEEMEVKLERDKDKERKALDEDKDEEREAADK